MAKKINIVGKKAERIRNTGPSLPRVEPSEFATAIGAEPCGEPHAKNLDPISLLALGHELLKRLRSTGGRPSLEGATEQCKVPLGPEDMVALQQIQKAIEQETGTKPSIGQLASEVLRKELQAFGKSEEIAVTASSSLTVKDFFDAERPSGDFVCSYRDWELPLSDGSKLTGCVSKYVVIRRLGAAYFELYLDVEEPGRAAGIINALLPAVLANPQFLLPQAMQNNEIKIRKNDQDVRINYNQLPILRTFTIFCAARVDLSVKEVLVGRWLEKGVDLIIRDQNYVDAHERELRPYAFISHDSRDKEAVARPLAERLRAEVGTIWYDEYSLKVGDSLRESIENGLKRSDRCVIVLSKAFLENQGWGKREFDSIYTREIIEKQKVMLPVWVDVTKNDLYQYSPILADRVGVPWSDGIDEVVRRLSAVLRSRTHEPPPILSGMSSR